jgi:type II restriction enzyme
MNLSMSGALGADYKSGSQRARVVTESWGEHNLYCPNCSSPRLNRLSHNTQASDFSCPKCKFWFQLRGQKSRIGNSITDGAYEAMMRAIQRNESPSYYFMHYNAASWTVRNLLLVPHFAFPPSAIVKRPPLSSTARRAGWVGCNFALNRIPADARIPIVTTIHSSTTGDTEAVMISKPEDVREKFRRIKPLKELSADLRGWVLDVLNIIRRLNKEEFTNADVYAFERELKQLHPGNDHIQDKIRQKLQVLRDTGFLVQVERGVWRVK